MRAALALGLLILVAGCRGPLQQRVDARVPGTAGSASSTAPPGERFLLEAGTSKLWIQLRPDGPLARAGHSHVISSTSLRGEVLLAARLEASTCAFSLPVDSLVVDDPVERAATGGEYAAPLDQEARDGTRAHMLGEDQLDAVRHPLLHLACVAAAGDAGHVQLTLLAQVAGHESHLVLPAQWRREGCRIDAEGEADVTQSSLGLTPFSALLGALRVADTMRLRYELRLRCAA